MFSTDDGKPMGGTVFSTDDGKPIGGAVFSTDDGKSIHVYRRGRVVYRWQAYIYIQGLLNEPHHTYRL